MSSKPSVLMLTAAGFLLLAGAGAQEWQNINIYSGPSCGDDPNDLETLSHQLSFSPKLDRYEGAEWSACTASRTELRGWETTDEGKYQVYVDTSSLDGDCWLNFYSTHPDSGFACQNKYKSFQKSRNSCPMVALSKGFGYAICCGKENPCLDKDPWFHLNNDKRQANASEPKATVSNVAEVKRAPLLSRALSRPEPRGGKCKFVKDAGTEVVQGPQLKKSGILPCLKDQTTCGRNYEHEVSRGVTDAVNVEVGVSVEFFDMLSVEMSVGYEHSVTKQESFSSTISLAPSPGHKGYITFRPKYVCAKGHTEGDCSGNKLEPMKGRKWCIPKLLPDGILDGEWEVVEVD